MPESVEIEDGGIWWPEAGYLWADRGQTSLPLAATRAHAETYIARYNGGEFNCAGCKKWFPKPSNFRRFAGLYCDLCTDDYKQRHSRICGLCRQPLWDCYC